MSEKLERNFRGWLEKLAKEWNTTVEQVALLLDKDYQEIANRERFYPKIQASLTGPDFNMRQFAEIAKKCYVLSGRFDSIRFNRFIDKGDMAADTIHTFITDFPNSDDGATDRINRFISKVVTLGYSTPRNSLDKAGAASLASMILTSIDRTRFVDFRQVRWGKFAKMLEYRLPLSGATYGEKLIWAGKFAKDISNTRVFKQGWSDHDDPLWVVAGICWHGPSPRKPTNEPVDSNTISFPEGAKKGRLHFCHERNQTVVHTAKSQAFERDPLLRCEACGFSFRETYGEPGIRITEAHHKIPVATLTEGSRTKVDDIALICANCHRMIHSDREKTLSLDELQSFLMKK